MQKNRERELKEKMASIANLIEQGNEEELNVEAVNYYNDIHFKGTKLGEEGVFVAKVANTKDNSITYEIYLDRTNSLIATVDTQGKIHFMPEYLESLREVNEDYFETLRLEDAEFELPELKKEDIILTKEEREHIKEKQGKEHNKDREIEQKEEKEEEEDQEKDEQTKSPEEEKREEIAKIKKVSPQNVLIVREDSNFYEDHPNLEPNLYFYRDNDGVVKAEYIDENGEPQPSQYFEPSTTSLREETVSLGDDGNPVTKQVPYQVMQTKGLNSVDKDIRDIRMMINIDTYGYLEIQEARQGRNGEWLSHDIEVQGRDYNSHAINQTTSIHKRRADPDKQTETYQKAENIGLETNDIQYDEMYLIEHADEIIEGLVKEGYQREEAIDIFNYMIGEENLTLQQAKDRVNEEIGKESEAPERTQEEQDDREQEEDEGRTPWGDAEERARRAR